MIPSGLVMVQNIPITKVITTCLFSFIFCGELKSSSSAFVNAKRHGGGSIVIDDRNHNIFWFMQITDLHLSKFGHKDRGEDLREFCSTHIPVIQPELVIASGDITDGKSSIIPGSSQHIEEWENYKSVLVNSGVLKLTKWFDIRGNHDAFDVPSSGHARDYYSQFGVKGKPPTKSYIFKVSKSYGQYSFVSIDLSLEPGIKWPFNFFGYLSMDVQKQLLKSITQAKGSNQTFIFGHHPTSTVVSQDLNLRSLIGDNAFAYLCGHLHTLHGTTKRMYVSQPQGYWEWELGDWRENRYYRIVAVDHDLVSFVDVVKSTKNSGVTEWPIILITNPKNSQFLLPNKEPVDRIKSSTHIRILVWSKWPIQSVSVKINDIFQGYAQPATLVDDDTITPTTQSPLYILSWNPSQWSDASHSFHTIEVTAKDTFGNQRTVTQPFSFQDPTEFKTGFLSRYFISTNLSTSVAVLYYMLWILMCTFVILPRFFHRPRFIGCLYRTRLGKGMYRLSSTNRILFVVLIYMLYSISCPIFMGYLVDDEFGYVFCYGIYINGIYLPEQLTYVLAAAQLLLLFIFLLSFSIHCGKRQFDPITSLDKELITQYSDNSLRTSNRGGIRFSRFHIQIKSNSSRCILIALVVHTFSQLVAALIFIWFPYGFIAFLLSPGCILPIIVSWILFIFCPQPDHVKHSAQ